MYLVSPAEAQLARRRLALQGRAEGREHEHPVDARARAVIAGVVAASARMQFRCGVHEELAESVV